MSLSRHVTVGSGLLVFVLGLLPLSAQQAVPAAIFGTWIWNSQRQKIDPKLGVYRCYVEVLDDLGGGRVRMRDYRIRPDGQVVKHDVTLEFGRIYERADGPTQWTIIGPLSYQMGPPDRDTTNGFIVTREIIEGGRVMRHVGEGMLNGIRSETNSISTRLTGLPKAGSA